MVRNTEKPLIQQI